MRVKNPVSCACVEDPLGCAIGTAGTGGETAGLAIGSISVDSTVSAGKAVTMAVVRRAVGRVGAEGISTIGLHVSRHLSVARRTR